MAREEVVNNFFRAIVVFIKVIGSNFVALIINVQNEPYFLAFRNGLFGLFCITGHRGDL